MSKEESKEQNMAEEEDVAEERAAQVVGTVVLEDLERQYFVSMNERESLKRRLDETENERNSLQELLLKQQEINKTLNEAADRAEAAEGKLKTAENKYTDSQERMDRMQIENDKLRDELSQLNSKNTDLAKQLASAQIQSKLKESEAIPLFHAKERLQTELDSLQSHATWLEQELEAKQKDCQRVQTQSRDRVLQLQLQLNQTTDELAQAQTKLSVLEKVENDLQLKLSQLTKDNLSLKTEMQEAEIAAKKDMQDKDRVCELQKEHIARWKMRCEDAEREKENLQVTAQKALEAGDDELEDAKKELKAKYSALLEEQKSHYEAKLSQVALVQPDLAIAQGTDESKDEEDGPFEMTELLQRWEDTKRALRTERWNHDRLKRTYHRLVADVRNKTPQMVRQREEFEMAIERNEALEKRLKDALQEKEYALADAKDAQKQASTVAKHLKRREDEAKTLALQVQALLVQQSGGEPNPDIPLSIEEIQSQNMKLLDEHRRLSQQIEDFEERLNSDTLKSELEAKSSEVNRLVQERERQEKIVEQIVQQRDLYRALVNRHDNDALGTESDESSMLDMVQKQSARLKSLEKTKLDLEEDHRQIQNALDSTVREKSILQERCKRYEIANKDLTSAAEELQSKLLEARGEGAKNLAESSYHKEKCSRLEESLDRNRAEIALLNKSRTEIQENVASMEGALSNATATQGRLESENRSYQSKIRSLEASLETEKATAARFAQDNGQLRDDIARQGAMIDHIRRIENSLSEKNETDMISLRERLSAATEKIGALESKHASEMTGMTDKLAESQEKVETLHATSTKSQQECLEAKKQCLEAKTELQSAKSHTRRLETQLRAMKRKLGEEGEDVDNIEVDLQQKIDALESELQKAKSEIDGLHEEIENYRGLAKSGETELSKTKKAAENFKLELEEEVNDLKKQVEQRNKDFESRSSLLQVLTDDLAGQREDREKIEHELKAEIHSLKEKIASDEALVSSTKASFEAYKADIQRYQKEVADAQQNYERELKKHAEARVAVRSSQEAAAEHQLQREKAEDILKSLQDEIANTKENFENERAKLLSQINTLEKRVEDSRDQNKLLHAQLDSINSSMNKERSEEIGAGKVEVDNDEQQKTIAELREIVRYLRSENEVCQTDLDVAKRAVDREKASAGVLRRSLEELRSELHSLQQKDLNSDKTSIEEVSQQLEEKKNQMRVLNDSNRLLREDAERLLQKLKHVEGELASLKAEAKPVNKVKNELEGKITALESENTSLRRELDSWKSRMTNLVKNLDQIDPEEHRKLVSKVEEMTKEKDSLNAWKAATENENQRIRGIATRMKKMNEEHQTTISNQKKEIVMLQGEKENLAKALNSKSTLVKERDDLKLKLSQVEKEKSAIKTELEGANNNSDRLRESMRRFKEKIASLEQDLANSRAGASEVKSQKRSTTDVASKVSGKQNEEEKPTNASSANVASPSIPEIPKEGFKFGPSAMKTIPGRPDDSNKTSLATIKESNSMADKKSAEITEKRRLSGETKELSMKEKLLMKKKRLEQEAQESLKRKQARVEAEKVTKRSKPDSDKTVGNASTPKTSASSDDKKDSLKTEGLKVASDEARKVPEMKHSTQAQAESSIGDASQAANSSGEVDGSSDTSAVERAKTTTSSTPTIGKGLSASATPFAPAVGASMPSAPFGSLTSPFGKSGQEGAFFNNMKPPGKTGETPTFSFGSKSNITLPTPTLPHSPAPFGSDFRSASSSSLGATKPLFGDSSKPAKPEVKDESGKDGSKE